MDISSTGESNNRNSHFYSQTAEGIHLFGPTLSQWISVSRASIAGHDFQQGDETCTLPMEVKLRNGMELGKCSSSSESHS